MKISKTIISTWVLSLFTVSSIVSPFQSHVHADDELSKGVLLKHSIQRVTKASYHLSLALYLEGKKNPETQEKIDHVLQRTPYTRELDGTGVTGFAKAAASSVLGVALAFSGILSLALLEEDRDLGKSLYVLPAAFFSLAIAGSAMTFSNVKGAFSKEEERYLFDVLNHSPELKNAIRGVSEELALIFKLPETEKGLLEKTVFKAFVKASLNTPFSEKWVSVSRQELENELMKVKRSNGKPLLSQEKHQAVEELLLVLQQEGRISNTPSPLAYTHTFKEEVLTVLKALIKATESLKSELEFSQQLKDQLKKAKDTYQEELALKL